MSTAAERIYGPSFRLKQKRFPVVRKSLVRHGKQAAATRDQQETLTQIEFFSPASSFTSVQNQSDDDEFVAPNPKKKRKVKAGSGQTTLTQLCHSSRTDVEVDGIVPVSSIENFVQETQDTGGNSSDGMSVSTRQPNDSEDTDNHGRPSNCYVLDCCSSPGRQIVPMHTLAGCQTRGPPQSPVTPPIQVRNSPETHLASTSSNTFRSQDGHFPIDISLKGELITSPSFRKPSRTTNILERSVGRAIQREIELIHYHHASQRRRSVVPDSQVDEYGEELILDDIVQSTYIPATLLPPPQPTQIQNSYQHTQQATYDPVHSALDRDAARFVPTGQAILSLSCAPDKSADVIADNDQAAAENASGASGATDGLRISLNPQRDNILIDLTDSSQALQSPKSEIPTPPRHLYFDTQSPNPAARILDGANSDTDNWDAGSFIGNGHTNMASSPPQLLANVQGLFREAGRHVSSNAVRSSQGTSLPFSLHTYDTANLHSSSQTQVGRDTQTVLRSVGDSENDSDDDDLDDLDIKPIETHPALPPRRTVKGTGKNNKGKRLKRAEEILPDTLLEFSLPEAPLWNSSPPELMRKNDTGQPVAVGEPSPKQGGDYSLAPPSSDWRSSGRN